MLAPVSGQAGFGESRAAASLRCAPVLALAPLDPGHPFTSPATRQMAERSTAPSGPPDAGHSRSIAPARSTRERRFGAPRYPSVLGYSDPIGATTAVASTGDDVVAGAAPNEHSWWRHRWLGVASAIGGRKARMVESFDIHPFLPLTMRPAARSRFRSRVRVRGPAFA